MIACGRWAVGRTNFEQEAQGGEAGTPKKAVARKEGAHHIHQVSTMAATMMLFAVMAGLSTSTGVEGMRINNTKPQNNMNKNIARRNDGVISISTSTNPESSSRRDIFRGAGFATNTNANRPSSTLCNSPDNNNDSGIQRRDVVNNLFRTIPIAIATASFTTTTSSPAQALGINPNSNNIANAADLKQQVDVDGNNIINPDQMYNQRFPTLFDPIYGPGNRRTIKRQLGPNIWSLEQNLQLGPLQTPLRCVVIQLDEGNGLWVHAPLAPTPEFFDLVESCGSGVVKHVVAPSYALEHKVFVKDALERWTDAQLWTSPGQFSFPIRSVSSEFVFGKSVDGVLSTSDEDQGSNNMNSMDSIPWTREIQYETLAAGTFNIGGTPTTFYETAFFHQRSKSLIVTDAVARIGQTVPELNDPDLLLLVGKRSTSDPLPNDTPEARLVGWEKTALLVSYFFPEHEEPDPSKFGVVTWTEGWHTNFKALSGRLLVPPVVRTLLYAQDPKRVREWVERASKRWEFVQIIPAHFDAPIKANPAEFRKAFAFLDDDRADAFPAADLADRKSVV